MTATEVVLKRKIVGNVTVPLKMLVAKDQAYLVGWAKEDAKNRVPRVVIKVDSNKRDSQQRAGYSMRDGQFKFEVSVENREQGFDIRDAKGTLVVFGEDFSEKDEGIVMERVEFKKFGVSDGTTTMLKGELTKYEYYNDGSKYGQKYDGYVFIMRNSAGKVVAVQGSTTRVESLVDRILPLKTGERFVKGKFEKIKSTRVLN